MGPHVPFSLLPWTGPNNPQGPTQLWLRLQDRFSSSKERKKARSSEHSKIKVPLWCQTNFEPKSYGKSSTSKARQVTFSLGCPLPRFFSPHLIMEDLVCPFCHVPANPPMPRILSMHRGQFSGSVPLNELLAKFSS